MLQPTFYISSMISCLSGRVASVNSNSVVIMTAGGVGYRVMVSPACLALCVYGAEVTIETYLAVKEDALDLYGFATGEERELFELFISISGVGPKTALNILALGASTDIAGAISRGDVGYLTKVSGIGKKTAERLVLELRSKIVSYVTASAKPGMPTVSSGMQDVVDGLEALGYSSLEVRETVQQLELAGKTSEQLLREALRMLGK